MASETIPPSSLCSRPGEEHLLCPSCQHYYQQPKILSCQHSACQSCLERDRIPTVQRVECPVCYQDTVLPQPGGVAALRPNLKLMDMVAAALVQRQRTSVPACTTHSWKETLVYCTTCSQLVCDICTTEPLHEKHQHEPVTTAAAKSRQLADRATSIAPKLIKRLEARLGQLGTLRRDLNSAVEASRQDVDERAQEEIDKIRVARQRIREEIDAIERGRSRRIRELESACGATKRSVSTALTNYTTALEGNDRTNDFDLLAIRGKIRDLEEASRAEPPEIDTGLSVVYFKRMETVKDVCLGKMVLDEEREGS